VDIGALIAAGVVDVDILDAPSIGLISSGDELVAAYNAPSFGQIRDVNMTTLAGLLPRAGSVVRQFGIARDEYDDLLKRARDALNDCDMVVITAGSSISTRDLTAEVIQALGEPGILQHGIAVKPGKPTIIALCSGKPVIGLPGNPASAYLVARQIILPIIARWYGETPRPVATIRATLTHDVPSASGREDTIPVRLIKLSDGAYTAEPIFGRSNLIFTLARADGLITITADSVGLRAGSAVEVMPL
jgi:molybdopterin molybdotransferase